MWDLFKAVVLAAIVLAGLFLASAVFWIVTVIVVPIFFFGLGVGVIWFILQILKTETDDPDDPGP